MKCQLFYYLNLIKKSYSNQVAHLPKFYKQLSIDDCKLTSQDGKRILEICNYNLDLAVKYIVNLMLEQNIEKGLMLDCYVLHFGIDKYFISLDVVASNQCFVLKTIEEDFGGNWGLLVSNSFKTNEYKQKKLQSFQTFKQFIYQYLLYCKDENNFSLKKIEEMLANVKSFV